MSDFCKHCGASFPHRFGEGRCQHCLPRAFSELETAHSEKKYNAAELHQAIVEAGFGTECHRLLLERAASIINANKFKLGNAVRSQIWLRDYKRFLNEEA